VNLGAAPPRWHVHPHNRPGYYRLVRATARRLPWPARHWLAVRVARLGAGRFPAERAAVRRNLVRVHPDRSAVWLDRAADRVFERYAVCFADLLSLNRESPDRRWRRVAGAETQTPTREALAAGRGCVSITAHLGNWELAGRALTILGRPVNVVMAPESDPDLDAVLTEGGDPPLRVVRLGSPLDSVGLVAALRRGEVVAFQMDRALGGRGDRAVPFFGVPARFPLGPFLVAVAAGAPVVAAFCVLEPTGSYRLHVQPAFDVRRGDEPSGLARAVRVLEGYVRAHWDQWFNFFDVWDRPAHA